MLGRFGKFSSSLYGNISAYASKEELGGLAGVKFKSEHSTLRYTCAIDLGTGEYLIPWALYQVLEA